MATRAQEGRVAGGVARAGEPGPESKGALQVSRGRLEASLAALRAEVRDPRAGVFGPDSVTWRVTREAALLLGGGRAALLQLAHPCVASAVARFSIARRDPVGRFRGTFRHMFRLVFGDLQEAQESARAIHRVHERIGGDLAEDAGGFRKGQRYRATDVEAQVWVLAVLRDTSRLVYERIFGPLPARDLERIAAEGRRMAMLFGIEDAVPSSTDEHRAYFEGKLETLAVTHEAAELGRRLLRLEKVPGGSLARGDVGLLTAHLLPEPVARGYGLDRGGAAGERRVERIFALARAVVPRLPARVRFVPAYGEAVRRMEGHTERDRIGEWMSALYASAR